MVSRFSNVIGTSERGSNALLDIIDEQKAFEYPKIESLIFYLFFLLTMKMIFVIRLLMGVLNGLYKIYITLKV